MHEYDHGDGCSITGGYVYRGAEIPELYGHYLFADYCSGRIWSLEHDGDTVTSFTEWTDQINPSWPDTIGAPASFGEDGFGELYVVDRGGGTSGGEIWKIIADPTGISGTGTARPSFRLGHVAPNPVTRHARFEITLDRPGIVSISVFDVTGRLVRNISSESRGAGIHIAEWDGRDASGAEVSSGAYFLRAELDGRRLTRRISVLR